MIYGTDGPVSSLNGVGRVRAEKLAKLGISTVGELLRHYPRAYEYRGGVKPLAAAIDGEVGAFVVTVASEPTVRRSAGNMLVVKFLCYDETRNCTLVFFNNQYIASTLSTGHRYRVYGKVKRSGKFIDIASPVVEAYSDSLLPLFPVYRATEGFPTQQIQKLIQGVMANILREAVKDPLPCEVLESEGLMPLYDALCAIHAPRDMAQLNRARKRLMFEEIFLFVLRARGIGERDRVPGIRMERCDAAPFKERLKFEPTEAQRRTMNEIYLDMTCRSDPFAMRRMVSGDVGSGKTLTAQFAAYLAVSSGFQAAIMVPTEILARQHYEDTCELLSPLGINVRLLIGEISAKQKKEIYKEMAEGTCHVVIGTHALITDKVQFGSLGLVVCDEQHRFGVNQRNALLEKGTGAHLLIMSATPIPRTLAMALFGDLSVSVIDTLPPGRKPVETLVYTEDDRERVNEAVRREVALGRQVYIVCSAVETEEQDEGLLPMEVISEDFSFEEYRSRENQRKGAVQHAKYLAQNVFTGLKVECIHGKMKGSEKAEIMERFAKGETDILVSTTVIEVGVNVPNATLMVVEDADLFGLSQLHQLRGRVGRGKAASRCILMSRDASGEGKERLRIMASEPSGYKIAEYDLKMRGPGEFLKENSEKIRQHGDIGLDLAEGLNDMALFDRAVRAAEAWQN